MVDFKPPNSHEFHAAAHNASPDYWGRRVIERHLGQEPLSARHYLLHSPDDRAGARGFRLNPAPPAPRLVFTQTLELARLQRIADPILADEAVVAGGDTKQVENLLLIGTSMGGARPKAIVEDDDGLWIAKFNRSDDRSDSARVEHAMLMLARACGLDVAESRVVEVGGRSVLLVKPFDRQRVEGGYWRARMVRALTLLRAEDTLKFRLPDLAGNVVGTFVALESRSCWS